MRKSYYISMIALLLTVAVFTVAFSLYRQNAQDREVTIGFGEIAELTVGGTSTETNVIGPDSTGSFTVNLSNVKTNEDQDTDKYTHGRFYVEVVQKTENATSELADQVVVTATVLNGSKKDTVIQHNDLVKVGETIPKGFVCELTTEPISVQVSYALSDTAKENFLDYAEQQVTLRLHWDFCESDTIKVNVYKRWDHVYYQIETGEAEDLNGEVLRWTTIEIDKSVKKITFVNALSDSAEAIVIRFEGNTAKEVWLTLNDNKVYTEEPSI